MTHEPNQPSQYDYDLSIGRTENPDLEATIQREARRRQVLDRMATDAQETENKVAEITQSWLRLTKGFSHTALAQAIANDKQVRELLTLATVLANAFEKEQETHRDQT
jgi:hypothetical protein